MEQVNLAIDQIQAALQELVDLGLKDRLDGAQTRTDKLETLMKDLLDNRVVGRIEAV